MTTKKSSYIVESSHALIVIVWDQYWTGLLLLSSCLCHKSYSNGLKQELMYNMCFLSVFEGAITDRPRSNSFSDTRDGWYLLSNGFKRSGSLFWIFWLNDVSISPKLGWKCWKISRRPEYDSNSVRIVRFSSLALASAVAKAGSRFSDIVIRQRKLNALENNIRPFNFRVNSFSYKSWDTRWARAVRSWSIFGKRLYCLTGSKQFHMTKSRMTLDICWNAICTFLT